MTKVFVEIVAPERIVFEHLQEGHWFLMTLQYVDHAQGTELTWRMRFEDPEEFARVKPYIIPANEQNFDRLVAYLTEILMQKVISADGTPIAYDRIGTGPALIHVLGATATRGLSAERGDAGDDTQFTSYIYDRRGRGDSGDSADTSTNAIEREIDDLEALIDAAGGSAFVFGHSSGAVLALRAAAKLGDKIPKLALYEPPFIIDDSRPPIPTDYVAHLRELSAAGRSEDALIYFMTVAVGIPAEYIDGMKQAPFWASSVKVAHTISYDGEIMGDTMYGDPATLQQFASITTPTLVMVGGNSPTYQQNAVKTLAEVLPNAQYRSMAGQDHGIAPEVLNPALVEFFRRLSDGNGCE